MKGKKIVVLFLGLLLLNLVVFYPNTVSATYLDIVTFESLNIQNDYEGVAENGYVYPVPNNCDYSDIMSDYTWGDNDRTMRLRCNRWDSTWSRCYVNFTIDYSYIGQIDIWFYIDEQGSASIDRDAVWYFYNDSTEVLRFQFEKDTDIIKVMNSLGSWTTIVDLTAIGVANQMDGYYHLKVTHVDGNEMNYSIYDADEDLIGSAVTSCRTGDDWETCDQFYFYGYHSSGSGVSGDYLDFYFDTFRFGDSDSQGSGFGDVSGFSSYCSGIPLAYQTFVVDNGKAIEQQVNTLVDGYIGAVDVRVGAYQPYAGDDDYLGYFVMTINGNPIGSPDYWVPDGNNWILRWIGFSIQLEDEYPLFEMYCTGFSGMVGTWNLGYCDRPSGWTNLQFHSDYSVYGNNELNGASAPNKAVAMCFYYTKYIPNPDYDDSVYTQPLERNEYQEYEGIIITGTISTKVPSTYVRLYKDGVRQYIQGFHDVHGVNTGYRVNEYEFTCSFVPNNPSYDGEWNVSLWRNNVCVASHNFTVINRSELDYEGLVYTVPVVTDIGQEFIVGWLYNKTYWDSLNGTIIISEEPNFLNAVMNYEIVVNRIQNDGTAYHRIWQNGVFYYYLCVNVGGTLEPIFSCEHFVGNVMLNEIHVTTPVLELAVDSEGRLSAVQMIYGYHSYLGSDVYIRLNDRRIAGVGSASEFTFSHTIFEAGLYTAELLLYQNGTELLLSNTSFVVVAPYIPTPQEQENQDLHMLLYFFFGIFLSVMASIFAGAIGGAVTFAGYMTLFSLPDFTFSVFPIEVAYVIVVVVGVIALLFLLK